MIDEALRASLSAFDDQALATLANPGLVRRARRDLEDGKLRLVSVAGGKAQVEADGQLVTIDERGPRAAGCACKSIAVCRHRIAAVLFLMNSPVEVATAEEPRTETSPDPERFAGELDLERAEKWAGRPAWRAALELVEEASSVEIAARSIAVSFSGLDDPVRILLGQGLDGIVSKASKARRKPYHAAAILAARRQLGLGAPEPAQEAEAAQPPGVEVDAAFLARVTNALRECALLGFNIAPVPLEESLFELSVSSRADSLPRLSGLLRSLAAQVRLRRQRAVSFDPDTMLELAATAHVLVRALQQPDTDPDRLAALSGSIRRSHVPSKPLFLVGCGGEMWRTLSGARGATAWFHDPENGRWYSASIARGPGQDPTFSPAEAWRMQSMWSSLPLGALAHSRIRLTGAGISADGRLSAPAAARATVYESGVAPDASWESVVRDWPDLRQELQRQAGIGLEASGTPAVCLIEIQAAATPSFDELAQQLVWPVRDRTGRWLALTLDHDENAGAAIEALETSARSGAASMALIRIAREGARLTTTPLTLFTRDGAVDLALARRSSHQTGKTVSVWDWLQRVRRSGAYEFKRVPPGQTDMAIAGAWRQLLDVAELGPGQAKSLETRIMAHGDRLESFGLPSIAALLRRIPEGQGQALLDAAYGLVLARRQRSDVPLLH